MEPFKALIFLAATGIVSLVGVGAAGFYAGYSAGRGNLAEIKAQIANAPVAISTGSGGTVSLKPVMEDIRALSKQVEALAAVKARPAADAEQNSKPVMEDIRALSKQVEALAALKARPAADAEQNLKPVIEDIRALSKQVEALAALKTRPAADAEQNFKPVIEDIRALSKQVEALAALKARPAADPEQNSKPVVEEIRALARQVEALKAAAGRAPEIPSISTAPDYSDALQDIRGQISALNSKFDKQEPKAPKALVDEIRSLSASVQAQEPSARRVIAEEVRSAVATLQNTEPKVPKVLMDEIRTISANVRPQDLRPQASIVDQIKVLTASIEALKSRLAEESGRGRGDAGVGSEIVHLQQLVATASDQFGKCQTQLASLAGSGFQQAPQPAPAASTFAVTTSPHREPSTVVFYDNVMLKKDQEKQYDEIGVRLALQSIGPRQVKVAVNRQGFGLAFGERKVFRSQDVECELNLMETNLNDAQARVSISCKR